VRNVFSLLFGNWFAKAYLLLVTVVITLVFLAGRFGNADASLASIFLLIFVTVPWSLLLPSPANLPSGWLGNVILFSAVAISALMNAALISVVVHGVRRLIHGRT
jgi:hypothetical protein